MRPELVIQNGNKTADIYNRGNHYTIEHYENGTWRMVKTARDIEEAKLMAESTQKEVRSLARAQETELKAMSESMRTELNAIKRATTNRLGQ